MKSTDLPSQPCPLCGQHIDATSDTFGEATPGPGDIAICLYCQGLLVFTDDMRHRVMTNAEWAALDEEHRRRLTRAQTTAREVVRAKVPEPPR